MRINNNFTYTNFGRAFTTQEKKAYVELLKDSKRELNIQDTSAIIFDFNVPSEQGYNTGIGTTFSESMNNFVSFLKTMLGITSVQVQPQGQISKGNLSPYSGTNYAYGTHIIDLKKLTTDEYANILSLPDIEIEIDKNDDISENLTEYEKVLGSENADGIQEKLLKVAFSNFKEKLCSEDNLAVNLNDELQVFIQKNYDWLQKNALFAALSKYYQTDDINKWNDLDKNLYSSSTSEECRQQRIIELEAEFKDVIDYENFKQFIADKQQKESRKNLNEQGIKLYGDCLIGFSQSEMWANRSCFRENLYYGGPDPNCPETNGIQTWGLPALDYTKLGECSENGDISKLGEVGKFLYDKYFTFFERYDGIRMDAAWQFVTPFIYQAINGNYEEFKLPEINFTIFNIMKAAAKDALGDKFDEQNPDNIMLELVGMSADKSRAMTINMYPHLYTTAYAEYDETPKKFLEKGYQNGKFYVGVGCHDNDSLVNTAKDTNKRKLHLAGMKRDYDLNLANFSYFDDEYQKQSEEEKAQEDFRNAKFAEIFTSSKQFFTMPDVFGMSERINISGKDSKKNWRIRIPANYEQFYFSQLSNGYGLNLPKVLANAMEMNHSSNDKLIQKCNESAEILRQKGPVTEQTANNADELGLLDKKFEYIF